MLEFPRFTFAHLKKSNLFLEKKKIAKFQRKKEPPNVGRKEKVSGELLSLMDSKSGQISNAVCIRHFDRYTLSSPTSSDKYTP